MLLVSFLHLLGQLLLQSCGLLACNAADERRNNCCKGTWQWSAISPAQLQERFRALLPADSGVAPPALGLLHSAYSAKAMAAWCWQLRPDADWLGNFGSNDCEYKPSRHHCNSRSSTQAAALQTAAALLAGQTRADPGLAQNDCLCHVKPQHSEIAAALDKYGAQHHHPVCTGAAHRRQHFDVPCTHHR